MAMDRRLLDWARAVKQRRRNGLPPLWYFTDVRRCPDSLPVVRCLPPCLAGVVFRHDGIAGRAELGAALARLCRARRIALVVAGDPALASRLRAGLHLRDGRRPGRGAWLRARSALLTSSAHDARGVRRAVEAGAELIFISPAFPTASHPGAGALGPVRWARLAAAARGRAAALGGLDGGTIGRLRGTSCKAIGAVGALSR